MIHAKFTMLLSLQSFRPMVCIMLTHEYCNMGRPKESESVGLLGDNDQHGVELKNC